MPTRIAIVAYPELSADDRQWIEDVRTKHDPQVRLIAAHVTLVFPCEVPSDVVAAAMSAVAACTAPIEFRISGTQARPDAIGTGSHVFLLPDSAASAAITTLHDWLYQLGVLQPYLRPELSFVPHITVAGAPAIEACRGLSGQCQGRATRVRGRLDEIVLVDVGTTPVTTLARCRLSQPAGTSSPSN